MSTAQYKTPTTKKNNVQRQKLRSFKCHLAQYLIAIIKILRK